LLLCFKQQIHENKTMKLLVFFALVAFVSAGRSRSSVTTDNELKRREQQRDSLPRLTQVEQCALCQSAWQTALENLNDDTATSRQRETVRDGDGVITADKACRITCPRDIVEQLTNKRQEERDTIVCTACRRALELWRVQDSARPFVTSAKHQMCSKFRTRSVKDDCEHTIQMYASDVYHSLRDGGSVSSVCDMFSMCNRRPNPESNEENLFEPEADEPAVTLNDIENDRDD
jgi:hypothetical protein